jgi:hypothetical protein
MCYEPAPDRHDGGAVSRVAIIGSCITRDLWPVRGDAAQDLAYVSRTSLPSLFSPAVPGFVPKPSVSRLKRHQHNAVVSDLQKTALARLAAFGPTHVIFDFIDERFDLLAVGGTLALDSWELRESGYLEQAALRGARRIPRLSDACERLWRRGAEEMAAFIRATPLRNARLILHVSRWAEQVQAADGTRGPLAGVEVLPGQPADIAEHNALLAAYEDVFCQVMPPLDRVDAAAFRVADAAHQWGLSPFHFIPQYYGEVWRQLEALGVQPSGSRASPSAPAA